MHTDLTKRLGSLLSLGLMLMLLAGCASQNVTPEVAESIADGANRIIVDRQVTDQSITSDAPAQAMFVDARQHMTENDWQIATEDEEARTFTTEGMMLEDTNMAMRFNVQVQPAQGGSRAIVAPEYRTGNTGEWQVATWTSGNDRQAFARAFDIWQGLSHTAISTEVQ